LETIEGTDRGGGRQSSERISKTEQRLAELPVGLLLNFDVITLTNGGAKRCVNPNLQDGPDGRRNLSR
jgi:hypothetical protein